MMGENMRDLSTLIIDNYDSFTYNLYQYICEITSNVKVFRNDKITLLEIERLHPDYIVISPGPKEPKDAGISKEVIKEFSDRKKILGVCLGHQSINEVFGGRTVRDKKVFHGKTSVIVNDQKTIFRRLPQTFKVARYHSLVVDESCLPNVLEVSARTQDGVIMGIRHKEYYVEGVQFHPESFLTDYGKEILLNFFYGSFESQELVVSTASQKSMK